MTAHLVNAFMRLNLLHIVYFIAEKSVGRMYTSSTLVVTVYLLNQRLRGFPVRQKLRIGMKRAPIRFRCFPAGMNYEVHESVLPRGILVGYPAIAWWC